MLEPWQKTAKALQPPPEIAKMLQITTEIKKMSEPFTELQKPLGIITEIKKMTEQRSERDLSAMDKFLPGRLEAQHAEDRLQIEDLKKQIADFTATASQQTEKLKALPTPEEFAEYFRAGGKNPQAIFKELQEDQTHPFIAKVIELAYPHLPKSQKGYPFNPNSNDSVKIHAFDRLLEKQSIIDQEKGNK